MTTLGAALLIFIAMIGLGLLIMQPVLASYTQNYMMRIRYSRNLPAGRKPISTNSTTLVGICKTIGQLTLQIFPFLKKSSIKQALIEANLRNPDYLDILTGAKVLCAVLPALLVASQATATSTVFAIVVAFFGWTLPNFNVQGRARQRKQKLFLELPTMLDLVAVCSRAGLGLMAAIDRVAKDMGDTCPVVKEELDQMLTDVKVFARPLRQVLKDMSERCGVEELENLTSALIIADQKGADVSSTLQKQSAALRERIKRKAEEQLSTAPVKMVPVIILFILPLMLVPTLGPAVMQLATTLQTMTQAH